MFAGLHKPVPSINYGSLLKEDLVKAGDPLGIISSLCGFGVTTQKIHNQMTSQTEPSII